MIKKSLKKFENILRSNDYETLNLVELDSRAVLNNIAVIKKNNPGVSVIPVLKANAYGHGLGQIAQILNQADCGFIAVDGYFEAASIRHITSHPILVMGYIKPDNVKLVDLKRCSFVIQDRVGLEAFGKLAKQVKVHIEINTGMNRLGLSASEINSYLKTFSKFPNLELEGVMTHLADADNPSDDSYTSDQVEKFHKAVEQVKKLGFNPKYIHIAQTAGSVKVSDKKANAIRLGIGLYGINPLDSKDAKWDKLKDLKPVMEIKSTVIKIIDLNKGDRVSYNGIFEAPKSMKIGVLPLGYYEGIPRDLSNRGSILYGKTNLPIVGRVCMNHIMIDLKNTKIKVGDQVTVISSDNTKPNSIKQIMKAFNLFPYSFVTGISSSIKRQII